MYENIFFARMKNAQIRLSTGDTLDAVRVYEKNFYDEGGVAVQRNAINYVVAATDLGNTFLRLGDTVAAVSIDRAGVTSGAVKTTRIIAPIMETIGDGKLVKIFTELSN